MICSRPLDRLRTSSFSNRLVINVKVRVTEQCPWNAMAGDLPRQRTPDRHLIRPVFVTNNVQCPKQFARPTTTSSSPAMIRRSGDNRCLQARRVTSPCRAIYPPRAERHSTTEQATAMPRLQCQTGKAGVGDLNQWVATSNGRDKSIGSSSVGQTVSFVQS